MSNEPSDHTILNLLSDLIEKSRRAGADAADAVAIESASKGISWREGQLEDTDSAESEDIGLRILIGRKQAMVSTSDRSAASLATLVERTIEMARAVPEDEYCGLAPAERLHTGPFPDLDMYDDTDPAVDQLTDLAAEAENAAREVSGVTNSDGASASANKYSIALATSHGFHGFSKGSNYSVSVSAIAGTGTGMERDYDFSSARYFSDLQNPRDLGHLAGTQAVRRLNPVKMKSGNMPVVFAPRVANSLLGHFVGAITGSSVARGTSFLKDHLGTEVFNSDITIVDDPLRTRGLKSRLFDGEGVRVARTNLVENGVVTTWLLNSATAQQLGMDVTGHASRSTASPPGVATSNLYIAPGQTDPESLIADIKDGLYVTELIGMGVNPVTGDYSRGAAGFRILDGKLAESVSEITIAGNLKEMFSQMAVASDLSFKYGSNAPTVRIDAMTVAGA